MPPPHATNPLELFRVTGREDARPAAASADNRERARASRKTPSPEVFLEIGWDDHSANIDVGPRVS